MKNNPARILAELLNGFTPTLRTSVSPVKEAAATPLVNRVCASAMLVIQSAKRLITVEKAAALLTGAPQAGWAYASTKVPGSMVIPTAHVCFMLQSRSAIDGEEG